jgi:hypothetical protein
MEVPKGSRSNTQPTCTWQQATATGCSVGNGGLVVYARSAQWLSLVDELFADYNNAIAKYQLNVEFILDGSATPGTWHTTRPLIA